MILDTLYVDCRIIIWQEDRPANVNDQNPIRFLIASLQKTNKNIKKIVEAIKSEP